MSTPQTPQQFFAQLVTELSASGGEPINASTTFGAFQNKTLREAVANVYWKETALLNLLGRPAPAGQADDQFGHVLSIHAIALQCLALITAIAEAAKIDVNKVLGAVGTSINTKPPATPPQES
jgi:hypothetical protein